MYALCVHAVRASEHAISPSPTFLVAVAAWAQATGEVVLDVYPNNNTYAEGQELQCVCGHNLHSPGPGLPKWKINGITYLTTSLPLHYQSKLSGQSHGISFKCIKEVNLTTIACCYPVMPYYNEDTCSDTFTVMVDTDKATAAKTHARQSKFCCAWLRWQELQNSLTQLGLLMLYNLVSSFLSKNQPVQNYLFTMFYSIH